MGLRCSTNRLHTCVAGDGCVTAAVGFLLFFFFFLTLSIYFLFKSQGVFKLVHSSVEANFDQFDQSILMTQESFLNYFLRHILIKIISPIVSCDRLIVSGWVWLFSAWCSLAVVLS